MTSHPTYILDISRLLARAGQAVPTGIDRVELAYADYLLTNHADRTYFVALSVTGWMGYLPQKQISRFIKILLKGWNLGEKENIHLAKRKAYALQLQLLLGRSLPKLSEPAIYLLLSHHHLMKQKTIQKFLKHSKAKFIPMVHDLIPIEYPEYARPRELERHKARMRTVTALADAVIVPTNAVAESLQPLFLEQQKKDIPIWTIPHGVHPQKRKSSSPHATEKTPYFVYLSPIEPRKNHLLLLHLWRDMVQKNGKASVPKLVLIGKRGWENENILDMLERSPALQDSVIEYSHLSDDEVTALLQEANGLLFSSFTEGYGLPLVEAMSLAIPSICADIPVLREVGGEIPHYCHPLDTKSWESGIRDFALHGPLWKGQKEKLKKWTPLSWHESVKNSLKHCSTLP